STGRAVTVKQACELYAKDKPEAAARFRRYVYPEPIAKVKLAKLTARQVKAWRDQWAATPALVSRRSTGKPVTRARAASTLNRDITALRAALNLAFEHGDVLNNHAWRTALKPIKNADKSRDVYLDRAERKALIDALPNDAAAFARGLCALPLRPGALAALTVGDFDKRTNTLKIGKDKNGKDRKITAPANTAELLKEQTRGKLPGASLFTQAGGAAWNKDAWKGPIKDAVRAAELPDNITAYALRHSTITDLIADGVPALTVAQLAGTSVAMIERHYGHLLQEQATAALAKLAL
ncbi:MAG: tyrosine-type recombinase/integrase, partial [Proteobacteria bacterium]|nr:tyrosine-type recombinase/integrase [Pseudomonadota bacterium]